jgi:hypothetical protein
MDHIVNERRKTMATVKTFRRSRWLNILGMIVCLLVFASPAFAGSGNVLPPTAQPKGYSLAEAAAATAFFNTGQRPEDELPADFPFQILWVGPDSNSNTFEVEPGTAFYVPIVWDSACPDMTDPQAVQDCYFDPAYNGAEYLTIKVDDKLTLLDPEYAVGVQTPGLRPGIDKYTVVAAFLTPLSPGTHWVTIAGRFAGAWIGGVFEFEITYKVIVG